MKSLRMVVALVVVLSGCISTKVTESWHDPAFQGPIRFQRTMVIAITPDQTTRRIAEDEIVRQIGEGRSVQSYKILEENDLNSSEQIRPRLLANGIDAVVSMRLVSTKHETTWLPGSGRYPYDPFWTYYDRAWPTVRQPGYLQTDTTVRVQTNIYSVKDGKLVWTALSDSFNPTDVRSTVAEICQAIAGQLRREGLLG